MRLPRKRKISNSAAFGRGPRAPSRFHSMGRRSVCDPFDAAAIVERITTGETTAADAYRRYAATAVRPYARATFAGALSRARVGAGLPIAVNAMRNLKRGVSGHEIRKRARAPDPSRAQAGPVLVIGQDSALRVRGGALDVEHGSGKDRVHVRIDVDEEKPAAILFDAHGEFLTGEAIRWCARYAIPLILPNGPGRAILFYESALEADGAGEGVNGKHAARILDVGPSLVRAQALADPVPGRASDCERETQGVRRESVPAIDKRSWSLRARRSALCRRRDRDDQKPASRRPTGEPSASLGLRERKWRRSPALMAQVRQPGQKGAQFLGSKRRLCIRSTPCSITPMWSHEAGGWREL